MSFTVIVWQLQVLLLKGIGRMLPTGAARPLHHATGFSGVCPTHRVAITQYRSLNLLAQEHL